MTTYHAVLIPGGGLDSSARPTAWVTPRLEAAIAQPHDPLLIPLSGGTANKPPPLNPAGYPITEAGAAADYLIAHGVERQRILCETCSLDTIGNAFFARLLHAEPRRLERLLVITSEFHMPRTEAIFSFVFGLPWEDRPSRYQLDFLATPNVGIAPAALAVREKHEVKALDAWRRTCETMETLEQMHQWLYQDHAAYAAGLTTAARPDETY